VGVVCVCARALVYVLNITLVCMYVSMHVRMYYLCMYVCVSLCVCVCDVGTERVSEVLRSTVLRLFEDYTVSDD
jgi:hypothetical protein